MTIKTSKTSPKTGDKLQMGFKNIMLTNKSVSGQRVHKQAFI